MKKKMAAWAPKKVKAHANPIKELVWGKLGLEK